MTSQTKDLFAHVIQTSREIEQALERIQGAIAKQIRAAKAATQHLTWLQFLKACFMVGIFPYSECHIRQTPRYGIGRPFL